MVSRRSFLASGSAALAALSGCQGGLTGSRELLDLVLYNYTDEPQPLQLEILRDDREAHNEAAVLDREFDVPPPGDGESAGQVSESDAVARRRYTLRVLLRNGRFETHHYHFYPGEASRIAVRIYRDQNTGTLYVRFY